MWAHRDTERTYLGTRPDIWPETRVMDEKRIFGLTEYGLRIFQTDSGLK